MAMPKTISGGTRTSTGTGANSQAWWGNPLFMPNPAPSGSYGGDYRAARPTGSSAMKGFVIQTGNTSADNNAYKIAWNNANNNAKMQREQAAANQLLAAQQAASQAALQREQTAAQNAHNAAQAAADRANALAIANTQAEAAKYGPLLDRMRFKEVYPDISSQIEAITRTLTAGSGQPTSGTLDSLYKQKTGYESQKSALMEELKRLESGVTKNFSSFHAGSSDIGFGQNLLGGNKAPPSEAMGGSLGGQKMGAGRTPEQAMDAYLNMKKRLEDYKAAGYTHTGPQEQNLELAFNALTSDQRAALAKPQVENIWSQIRGLDARQTALQNEINNTTRSMQNPQAGGSGGVAGGGPQIDANPIYSDAQIQQQVNAQRAQNDATALSQSRQTAGGLAGRGISANSPLAMAMQQAIMGRNMMANTDNERDLRLQSAQANADHVLNAQQARESQYASRQDEDIRRKQTSTSALAQLMSILGSMA